VWWLFTKQTMKTNENVADEIRQPENQIEIAQRLSAYAKRLRGED